MRLRLSLCELHSKLANCVILDNVFANKATKGKQQCNCLLAVHFWIQCYNRNRKKSDAKWILWVSILFWQMFVLKTIWWMHLFQRSLQFSIFQMRISYEYVPWTNWNENYIDYKFVIDMEFVTWLSVCRSKKKKAKMTSTFNERHLKIDLINQMS